MTGISLDAYRLFDEDQALTPALLVYPKLVDGNIRATLRLMGGDANRWRPHLKTSKMPWMVRLLLAHGVQHFKCATTLELQVACASGARDVLVAYPMVGANARRVLEIARAFEHVRISVLVESEEQARAWVGGPVGMFVDVNPGMDRTGIDEGTMEPIVRLAGGLKGKFRGVHYYDGHITDADFDARQLKAHGGYDQLMKIVGALEASGIPVGEVITSGTPAFPAAMVYSGFLSRHFVHRASPGTVLFHDASSLASLPASFGYAAATVIMATVVSHPAPNRVTCNAGHKSVSADAGVPTCVVIGHPELTPLKPSEEHLPMEAPAGAELPKVGQALYLLPRHICPSVNQFDEALLIEDGRIVGHEPVAARGHEHALVA